MPVLGWMRLALADLRGDVRQFGLVLACLILGTGIVATVGSVGSGLRHAVARDAVALAGGDLDASPINGRASPADAAFLGSLGEVTRIIDSTAQGAAGDNSVMVDLLAVSDNYPAAGVLRSPQLAPGQKPSELLRMREGTFGAIADERVLRRLGIQLNGMFKIGRTQFQVRGVITDLPDAATRGFELGYPAIISLAALETMTDWRLPLPGLLTQDRYKLRLTNLTYEAAARAITTHFGDGTWLVRSPRDVVGDITRYYDLFAKFTLLVGLSSLLIGGVGVSNGVAAYVGERRQTVAVFRSLGATGPRIVVHFLTQIVLVSLVGVGAGVVLGAAGSLALLPVIGRAVGADLPQALDPQPLLAAAAFGILVSFSFAYVPLMQARRVSPALLFRQDGAAGAASKGIDWAAAIPSALSILGVLALATLVVGDAYVVGLFGTGVLLTLAMLFAGARGLQQLLKTLPTLPIARARIAMRNIYRPGAPAPVVILSIGLGLAVLLIIALLSANLQGQLQYGVRSEAPNFIIAGLFDDEVKTVTGLARSDVGISAISMTPQIEAQVLSINGRDPKTIANIPEEAELMLTGAIPVTYSVGVPEHSEVVDGAWWPADYAGPALISLRDTMKFQLGLRLGDHIVFNVAQEPVEATIASFRRFDWQDGSNLMVTFSPGTLDPAQATSMAAIKASPGRSGIVEKALMEALPGITIIPIGDALDQAAEILVGLSRAVGIMALLAVANGILVLAGTIAAGRRNREQDALVQKVLGATRREVLVSFAIEYLSLGAFAAILASAIGISVAWTITRAALEVPFAVDPLLVCGICLSAIVVTIAVGAVTTWQTLSKRPSLALRAS